MPPSSPPSQSRQDGFTVVEIMVAMVISLILLAGVIQLFVGSKVTYRAQEGLARMQENGRFAVDYLARDLRVAGYQGCARRGAGPGQIEPNIIASSLSIPTNALSGQNNLSSSNAFNAKAGTDTVTVTGAIPPGAKLTGNMTADNANIQIESNPGIEAGDILLITDCINADIFRATGVSSNTTGTTTIAHANSTNSTNRLSKPYGSDAQVFVYRSYTFYVKDTGRTNDQGAPVYALFRRNNLDNSDLEVLEGVEDIQTLYGLDTDGDRLADSYAAADTISGSQWDGVVATRSTILASSVENYAPKPQSYSFMGSSVTPSSGDTQLRGEFSATVQLRNRGT